MRLTGNRTVGDGLAFLTYERVALKLASANQSIKER